MDIAHKSDGIFVGMRFLTSIFHDRSFQYPYTQLGWLPGQSNEQQADAEVL